MQTPALLRQKASGRGARSLRSRDVRGRSGDCGRATRHLPADRGAAAPGSAAAAASTPLACDREGRLVLTARGDWQASGPLRSLASQGVRADQSSLRRGVPEREEWNVFWSSQPSGPHWYTRRGCASQGAHPQALLSTF